MKILHFVDTGGIYGKEQMVLYLIKKQIENGHTVSVAGFGKNDFFDEAALIVNDKIQHYADISDFRKHLVAITEYDVIHTHDYKTGILLALWHISHPSKVVIRTIHGYTSKGKPWHDRIRLYESLDRFMYYFNTQTVGVSEEISQELGVKLIHNGIDHVVLNNDETTLRQDIVEFCKSGVDDKDTSVVFCCMARLSKEKNLEVLINAIFNVDGAKLLILGDGPLRDLLSEKIKHHPEKVMLAGFVKDSKQYLSLVDIYIQPSLTEGMPISILEALSAGVPIMASNVGGMKILHKSGSAGDTGTGTTSTFMGARIKFMMDSKIRQDLFVANGKKLFSNYFSSDKMYEEYLKLYMAELVAKR